MARKRKKQEPRRLFGPIFFTLLCLFVWASVLTFDVADWPNPSYHPHNAPAVNACGQAGAMTSYQLFYWLGDGVYPFALFGTMAAGLWLVRGTVINFLQRTFGVTVLIACTSATIHLISDGGASSLAVGDGGVLGAGLGTFMINTFAGIGTTLVLIYSFLVGLLFTAEGWVLRFPGAVDRVREASGEAIAAARNAVAEALPRVATVGGMVSDDTEEASPPKRGKKNEPRINPGRADHLAGYDGEEEQQGSLFEEDTDSAPPPPRRVKPRRRKRLPTPFPRTTPSPQMGARKIRSVPNPRSTTPHCSSPPHPPRPIPP